MSGTTTTQGTDRGPRRWRFIALASSFTLALAGLVGLGLAPAASADTLPVCPDTTVVTDTVDGITSTVTTEWTLSGNLCIADITTVYTRAANPAVPATTCDTDDGYVYDPTSAKCTKTVAGTWEEKKQKQGACMYELFDWKPFQDPAQQSKEPIGWNCGRWHDGQWVTDLDQLYDPWLFKHEAWIQECPRGSSPEVQLTCNDDSPPPFQCVFPTMTPTGGTPENCVFNDVVRSEGVVWRGPVDGICSLTNDSGDEMTATCPVAGDVLTDGACLTPAEPAKFGREGGAAQFCLASGPVVVSWDGVSGYGTQLDADAAATTVKANALAAAGVPVGTAAVADAAACVATNAVAPAVTAPVEVVTPAPATVAAPAAATVAAPAPAAVGGGVAGTTGVADAATVPAAVPAGDGSQAPTVPIWALAMIAVGVLGMAAAGRKLVTTK